MRNTLLALLMASSVVLAFPASADEYDFVGYRYSHDTKRDYDRGFFFGAEAWFPAVRGLHFEPVISSAGGGTIGGRLLDVDFDYLLSGRYFVGWKANRRVGTFGLSYWGYDESEGRAETGGLFTSTDTHPARGDVTRDSFTADADVTMQYAEATWTHEFGEGRRFTGIVGAGLTWYEMQYQTQSLLFNAAVPADGVLVTDFTETKGYGGKGIVGGRYQFNSRFSMAGTVGLGFSASEQDFLYTDQNTLTGSFIGTINRQDTEITTLQYEGDLNFHLRAAVGFEIDWGYRFMQFDDAVAKDRFVDNASKFVTVEQPHELSFDGPYINVRYVTGLAKVDSDGDAVLDVYDDCPDTPAGAWVDQKGCPRDIDQDGVYDGIDRCPGTPFGTRVDEWGCGVDSDGDTVPDGVDLCPNTPSCARVDARGCPTDVDGDTVSDGCDACPATPKGRAVDSRGCETESDSDGDTVPDDRDRCPNTERGQQVDEHGCAVVVTMMVHFATDSAEINPTDRPLLDRIAAALVQDGGNFEVAGHADARATVEYNQGLSERRAESVRQYLMAAGVPGANLTAVGYSELRPIATNDTPDGMTMNRRVEIVRR